MPSSVCVCVCVCVGVCVCARACGKIDLDVLGGDFFVAGFKVEEVAVEDLDEEMHLSHKLKLLHHSPGANAEATPTHVGAVLVCIYLVRERVIDQAIVRAIAREHVSAVVSLARTLVLACMHTSPILRARCRQSSTRFPSWKSFLPCGKQQRLRAQRKQEAKE